jgi:hypothetical protein
LHHRAVFVFWTLAVLKLQPVIALELGFVEIFFDEVKLVVDNLRNPFAI